MKWILAAPLWLKIFIALAVVFCALRFIGLEQSPPGFYVDEAAISAQVICLRQSAHDLYGHALPLFSPVLGGGYATPAYLYTGALWTGLFGDSVAAFRSLAAFYGVLTVVGVYFLALVLWSRREIAWLAAACAAISPWEFLFSRIAWDPPLAPCFWVWALYFLFSGGKKRAAFAGLLGALSCYSYPPLRVQVALSIPALLIFFYYFDRARLKATSVCLLVAAVALIPLVRLTLSGEIQGRFNVLSIWGEYYTSRTGGFSWGGVLKTFGENMWLHLSPSYLFFSGDRNLRHSTQSFGEWSWLEIAAIASAFVAALLVRARKLGAFAKSRDLALVLLLIWLYLSAIIPAALTWESNPHALRSIGATPFVALLAGWCLWAVIDRFQRAAWGFAAIAVSFAVLYSFDFFQLYPARSELWFDSAVVKRAADLNSTPEPTVINALREVSKDYPDIAAAYFELRAKRSSCR